jgi:hypothetical protein
MPLLPPGIERPGSTEEISLPCLLAVEGIDPFGFFLSLLKSMGLSGTIEVRNFGGNGDLAARLKALASMSSFQRVRSLGIVRDAETNAAGAFAAVQGALRRAQLPVPRSQAAVAEGPPRVTVFILPDRETPGMIETLCLRAVAGDPVMRCVDEFLTCSRQAGAPLGNETKARFHAFLASRDKPGQPLRHAVAKSYFPLEDAAFQPLREFLQSLKDYQTIEDALVP